MKATKVLSTVKNVVFISLIYCVLPFVFFSESKAQAVKISGDVVEITTSKKAVDIHANCTKSRFKTIDGKQLWFTNKNRAYFTFETSKKGNEYRKYCSKEVSAELRTKE